MSQVELAGEKKRNLRNLGNDIILTKSMAMMDVWIYGFLPIYLNVQKCCGTSSKMCVNLPQVAATMCIGPEGDLHGNSAAECAIRMARAGQYDQSYHDYHVCFRKPLFPVISMDFAKGLMWWE